jgi:2-iminobutanoate/2-iminopropanoate deaminase
MQHTSAESGPHRQKTIAISGGTKQHFCIRTGFKGSPRQVGENVRLCLEAAGATLADLVRTTTYVTDIDELFKHSDIRHRYFGPALPTSTTIEVRRLALPDYLVEIDALAIV